MGSQLVVSYSQLNTYRRCKQAHHFKYTKKLRPREKGYRLALGDVVHQLLEAEAKGQDWQARLAKLEKAYESHTFEEERDADLIKHSKNIMLRYRRHWKYEPLEYELVEERLGPIELVPGVGFVFQVDGVVKDQDGSMWLLERKTRKAFKDPGFMLRDFQSSLYCWGLRELGYEISGVLWDEIRTKVPSQPRVLKNGRLSVAQKIDTDRRTYLKAIKKLGQDPEDYRDVLKRLSRRKEKFFRRQPLPVTTRMSDLVVNEARKTALEIKRDSRAVMELGFYCQFCEYSKLCSAKLDGVDTKFILKAEYKKGR